MGAEQSCYSSSAVNEIDLATTQGYDANLPPPSVIDRKIQSPDEFKECVTPSYTFANLLASYKVSAWTDEAFKRRASRTSIMSDSTGYAESFERFESNSSKESAASNVSIESMDGEIYKLKDGRVYQGQWVDGLMHGFGVMFGPEGQRYEGGFVKGKREGEGILTWEDGRQYQGQFVRGKPHGQGTLIGSFGEKYSVTATNGNIATRWE
eukprot:TRINITY_DN100366_c0_g1_i1.p1 TRINITY_DN100366_c0_g1~~TRINITY_DN100366_c0_g1_i1.p1  ORF type:complete len:209 (+),score=43.99 TRINITY_DN100366_c0_g1_i1:83-709(+)